MLKGVARPWIPTCIAVAEAFLAGDCGQAWSPDAPLDGVACVDESCFLTQSDAISDPFLLADPASCRPMLLVRGAVLAGNGDRLVLLGPLLGRNYTKLGKDQYFLGVAAVAQLEGPKPSGCLPLHAVLGDSADVNAFQLHGAAATVAPDGSFVAFVGSGRTERVVRLMEGGPVSSSMPLPGMVAGDATATTADADETATSRALRLADGGTLVVRSIAGAVDRVLGLEWIEPGETGASPLWPNQSKPPYSAEDLLRGSPHRLRVFESDSRIVLLGENGIPVPFSRKGELALEPAGSPRGREGKGGAVVALPRWQSDRGYQPGSVLVAGGGPEDATRGAPLDVYQPGLDSWLNVATAPWSLHYSVPVLLPTGIIAFIGGRKDETRVVYVDTKNRFAITEGRARMARPSGVGTSALLLPTGAVFVTGGYYTADYRPEENDRERPEVQILQPPYMTGGRIRPVIAAPPPEEIRAGEPFTLRVEPARSAPAEVVLMAFGATAAGENMAQRLVELAITDRSGDDRWLTVMGPPSLEIAPPGRYLIFVVDGDRLPSPGVAVTVSARHPELTPP